MSYDRKLAPKWVWQLWLSVHRETKTLNHALGISEERWLAREKELKEGIKNAPPGYDD
jgi:hypothetical protein